MRPNFLMLLSDDQDDATLSVSAAMPFAHAGVEMQGATFRNFFAHTPVCCPSRVQLMTGRYMHHMRAPNANVSTCMSANVRGSAEDAFLEQSFVGALQRAGWVTHLSGKYLNSNELSRCALPGSEQRRDPPRGWTDFAVLCPDTCNNNCNFTDNGQSRQYPGYPPEVIGKRTLRFLAKHLATSRSPFFACTAPHSPHSPFVPSRRYAYASVAVSSVDKIKGNHHKIQGHTLQQRLRMMRTLDDTVKDAVSLLQQWRVLNQTFVIVTSDHGLHGTDAGGGSEKRTFSDLDLRVPFVIAGPSIPRGLIVTEPAGVTDVAATVLHLAGFHRDSKAYSAMDGRSMVPLLSTGGPKEGAWRTAFLVEYFHELREKRAGADGHNSHKSLVPHTPHEVPRTFRGLRFVTPAWNWAYFEVTDEHLDWNFTQPPMQHIFFNLTHDLLQKENIYHQLPADHQHWLSEQLAEQSRCAGQHCA